MSHETRQTLLIAQIVMIIGIQPFGWIVGWYWDRTGTLAHVFMVAGMLAIASWPTLLRIAMDMQVRRGNG